MEKKSVAEYCCNEDKTGNTSTDIGSTEHRREQFVVHVRDATFFITQHRQIRVQQFVRKCPTFRSGAPP
ncbi:hypothetical protein E2C01_055867 [Portunus trituberculatus]|uniref:Uncharacterized protein n=1 Tax=Portunus trituberculatus TaxID=210409 RepID=A0A5B7GNW9_PORTR|nr:hypothetical protein [Portunus trituberculatus]